MTIFANTVSIGGALDLSREGNTEILVENFSSLVAGINGETSKWIAESDSGLPVVHSITINSRASLTIGNLEARARFDPVADGQPSQSQVNITLDFGTFTQTGNSGLLLGGPSIVGAQPNAVLDIVDGVFNCGAGVNRISNLGKIIVGTFGVARFNGDIELDGGQITVLGTTDQRLLLKGHDLTARDGAQVDLTYDFTVADGTRIDLSGRSALSIGGDFSLGSIGPGFSEDGVTTELLASGPGTMLTVGGTSEWANRGDSAFVAFTNGARGELQDLLLARGDSNPNPAKTDISHGTLLVSGGFDADTPTHVIVGSITASSDFSNTPEALIRVADGAILEMRSGDHFVSLGHFGGFDPFRIVRARLEVASGALFDGALATGDFILSDTADVVIDAAAFKIGGNLVMNGGQFFYQNPTAQSAFELPDDATITVKRFGVFNYEDTFTRDADLITIESGGRFAAKRLLLPTAELTVSGTGGPKNTSARLKADSAVIAATVTLEGSGVFNIEDRDFLFESAGALKIGKSDEGFDGTGTLNVLAGGRANVIGNIRIGGLSSTGDAVSIVTLDGGSLHQEIAEGAFPQDGSPPPTFIFIETSIGSPFAGTESVLSVGTGSQFRGLDTNLRLLERGRVVTGGGEITVARIDFEGGTLDITAGDVTAERTINFFEGTFQTGNGTLSTAEFNVHGALEIDDGMIVSDALNVGGTLDLISGTMSAVAIDVDGALNLVGGTTLSTTDFNIDGALDVDDATISSNALQVGGTLDVHSGTVSSIATIDIEGTLKVNSGTISSDAVTVGGTLDLHSGMVSSVAFGVDGALEIDGGTISSDALNVGGTMDVHGGMVSSVALDVDGALKLDGGSISTTTFSVGGAFDYQSGSLQVTGDDVVVGLAGQLGPAFELTSAHDLEVTQNVVIDAGAGLTLSSNTVAAAAIVNDGDLQIGALKVASDVGMIHNSGHIAGDGRIGAGLDNQAGGDLEAAAGTELRFTGSGNTNAGEINIDESSVEFTNSLINMAGGFIGGSGLLATGGANAGLIEFTQDSDVLGDIDNMPGGQIIASGHSTLTLFDDVVHNGAEIRANSGSSIVFFGGMTGAAVLTGGGDFFLEGDTRPGNSPGLLDFDGNVTFGGLNTLEIELGGLTRVTEYDAVDVSGTLALGGALNVVLFDLGGGLFTPQLGNVFDIFDAGSIVGSFAGINLPSLRAGLLWNTSLLESAGELSVAAVPLPPSVWMLMSCAALLMWRRRPAP